MKIVEIGNARFVENCKINGSTVPWDVEIKKIRVWVPLTCASSSKVIAPQVVPNNNEEKQQNNESIIHNEPIVEEPQEVTLRRSQRERKLAISNDYVVYLHKIEINYEMILVFFMKPRGFYLATLKWKIRVRQTMW